MERSLGASDVSAASAFFRTLPMRPIRASGIMIRLRRCFALFVMCALFGVMMPSAMAAATSSAQEYQVKAVFLYNFTQFVGWPPANAQTPIVIGILGDDPFGAYLDNTVRGEKVGEHPLIVRRYRRLEDVDDCQILFISRSEAVHFDEITARLKDRSILTVSDADQSGKRGGIVRFFTENDRVKLRINVGSAKTAGLTISSKLLRVAEIDGEPTHDL